MAKLWRKNSIAPFNYQLILDWNLFLTKGLAQVFLNGPSAASFSFIFIFSNKYYIFYNKYVWENVHPELGARIWTHNLHLTSLLPSQADPIDTYLNSVTRLGNLLDFGQVLKPLATINLPKSPTFLGNFCKGVKNYHFSNENILGNFYRHLAIFFWSRCLPTMPSAFAPKQSD